MLVLKGRPSTYRIDRFEYDDENLCWVRFLSGFKMYSYSVESVELLSYTGMLNLRDYRILNKKGKRMYPIEVGIFSNGGSEGYRLLFRNGNYREFMHEDVIVVESVLKSEKCCRLLDYFKDVSALQVIETEIGPISLHDKYKKIDFIDSRTALASYLDNSLNKAYTPPYTLLYPFYSNLSQMKAVENAFKSQISIVQGPPGTGKTQTILNIIANILAMGKTVMVVSNNNSAVENVGEKMQKEGLGFLIAKLGRAENKECFLESGQCDYPPMDEWKLEKEFETSERLHETSEQLIAVFKCQNLLADNRRELAALRHEQRHFIEELQFDDMRLSCSRCTDSRKVLKLWIDLEDCLRYEECSSLFPRMIAAVKKWIVCLRLRRTLGRKITVEQFSETLLDLKALYYKVRISELTAEIADMEEFLKNENASELLNLQSKLSMSVLKHKLYEKYEGGNHQRRCFVKRDFRVCPAELTHEYPVVLSTTFSAVSSLPGYTFDYLIMDEASQVSIESAALSLFCAFNAVIVGDTKQLTNIVSRELEEEIRPLNKKYDIENLYDCSVNNFLFSVSEVLPDAPQVLLREHYRCHPMIIEFCNQKFYGGDLQIMTTGKSEDDAAMQVIHTVAGNHSRYETGREDNSLFNRREVEELSLLLDKYGEKGSVGVIAPYRGQVRLANRLIDDKAVEIDTIHKYQGREMDTIIMTTVADTYNDFVDNANLLNVAVSRAKKKFIMVTNGNENPENSNIADFISYITYNNGTIVKSDLHSVFDLLYTAYSQQRISYLKGKKRISRYDSENIIYNVLKAIIRRNQSMTNLRVLPFYHLNSLISDSARLTEEEKRYAACHLTHLDFLIENYVSKRPLLAIEVDGYAFHQEGTRQKERDRMKDSILNKYHIPILRLSTTGSGEVELIENKLKESLGLSTI